MLYAEQGRLRRAGFRRTGFRVVVQIQRKVLRAHHIHGVQAGEKLQAIERLDVSLDDADAESVTSVDADSRGEQS